jgi:hypothetical protein
MPFERRKIVHFQARRKIVEFQLAGSLRLTGAEEVSRMVQNI